MDLPLPPPPKTTPFGLVSVCGLLTELEDVGRVVALAGYGHEARRLPFLCASLARDDELLVATRTAVYGSQRRTRLMCAARSGDVRRVTALLRPRGAEREVDAVDAEGRTALHHASEVGRVETVRLLLDKGADKDKTDAPRQKTSCAWRPLHYASAMGHAGVARLLLERGAATEVEVEDVESAHRDEPIHLACSLGRVEVVRLLLDAKASNDVQDSRGRVPIVCAIVKGQTAVVTLLLDRGFDVNAEVLPGVRLSFSPLRWAVEFGREDIVHLLLERGADVDMALHSAAAVGSLSLTRLFLERGADPFEDPFGDDDFVTPMDVAQEMLDREGEGAVVDPEMRRKLAEVVAFYEALATEDDSGGAGGGGGAGGAGESGV
jgi:ankyrin repeat protein